MFGVGEELLLESAECFLYDKVLLIMTVKTPLNLCLEWYYALAHDMMGFLHGAIVECLFQFIVILEEFNHMEGLLDIVLSSIPLSVEGLNMTFKNRLTISERFKK